MEMRKKNNQQPSMPNIGSDSGEEAEEVEESVETPKEAKINLKPKRGATKNATKGKKMAEKVTEPDDEDQPTEKPAKKTAPAKKTIVIKLKDMKNTVDMEKKPAAKKKPIAKKKVAAKKKSATENVQNENDDADDEETSPNTSISDENVLIAKAAKNQTLKEMMSDGIKFLTDRDKYGSLKGVEKYLKDVKSLDTVKNRARIKTTLHGFFDEQTIKQKDTKKKFSISVQFVMNGKKKTAADPISKRKSIKMAKKKKKQNDSLKKIPKTVAIIEHAPATTAETNDNENSDEYSDDEDIPPVKRPVIVKRR